MAIAERKDKIVRIVTRLNIGGPALHAALLTTQLDPQRFSTCLVVGEPDSREGDLSGLVDAGSARRVGTARVIHLTSLRRPIRPWFDLLTLWRLCGIARRERPQVIHTHMAKAGALGRLAGMWYNHFGPGRALGARAILIHTFHGHVLEGYFSPWLSRRFVAIERWLARRTDGLIAVSPAIRDELLAKGIGRPAQWRVIPLGLDLSAFTQLPSPRADAAIRVGMVGRLVPIKNPVLFLQALHQLAGQHGRAGISGLIVGDGPLRSRVQEEVDRLGLGRLVRVTGWHRNVSSIYAELDAVCLTSWNEGTPVSLIEAMAAGRPVIATEVGGVPDLLGQTSGTRDPIAAGGFRMAERGILIQPGDAEGLVAALKRLRDDAGLRKALGEAGRRYASSVFDHRRLIRAMSALYDQVCLSS